MPGIAAARRSSIVGVLILMSAACRNTPAAQVAAEQRPALARPDDSIAITNVTVVDVISGAQ